MPHPHEYLLKEYQVAINNLAPTVPVPVKEEAEKMHNDLLTNEAAGKDEIIAAMIKTGEAEYPHRHAFEQLKTNGTDTVNANSLEYQTALQSWQKHEQEIMNKINELEALKDQSAEWAAAIADKARVYREGFLVTERDPKLEEVEKEIEYWQGKMGMEV